MNRAQRITHLFVLALLVALLLPVYLLLVLILLPAMGLPYLYRSLTIRWRLRRAWPAHAWILVAYTQSEVWAPRIESEVLPRLGDVCIAIDRSRPDWKARHPAEARAVAHWGGYYEHNPLIVLFPRWRPARTIRLYHAFRDAKHGKSGLLRVQLDRLYGLVGR